jgi:hypothetical protein
LEKGKTKNNKSCLAAIFSDRCAVDDQRGKYDYEEYIITRGLIFLDLK